MVPAHLMGLKIKFFRKNLLDFFRSKENLLLTDSVIKLAHIYNLKKINSIILINYASELEDFLYWTQQLIAESLGKKGKGIIPVVSPMPRDHHSLLQLYLDGPKDKLFYIFSLKYKKHMKIKNNVFGSKYSFIENKKLSTVKDAQKKALIQELKSRNIPYREFRINKVAEETLGELFSYFILETALIGNIIGVDPFNQPAVEQVKSLTKRYLS
jgi:glucose-6-phosphate isomerase